MDHVKIVEKELELKIYVEDQKTGLKSQDVLITFSSTVEIKGDDFVYRATFLFLLFIFTLVSIMIVISLSASYNEERKSGQYP